VNSLCLAGGRDAHGIAHHVGAALRRSIVVLELERRLRKNDANSESAAPGASVPDAEPWGRQVGTDGAG
jgi:hypothetical protein